MAFIQSFIDKIRTAKEGRDVRGSLADGIDAINKETESTTNRQVNLDATFEQLIINAGESNAEIVAARHDNSNGQTYDTLPKRLDATTAQLATESKRINFVKSISDTVYRGLCVRGWDNNYFYGNDMRITAPSVMSRISGDSIQVNINHYQATLTANAITEHPIPMSEVKDYVNFLHSNGYKIMIKPQVEITTNEWRASIDPTDPDAWFASYTTLMLSYASMCEENEVEILSIGSEYHTLSKKYPDKWRSLIKEIRSVYNGKLIYSASFNTAWADEAAILEFWESLDVIGVNFYTRIGYDSTKEPYEDSFIGSYLQTDVQGGDPFLLLDRLANKYGKNIIFTEFGNPFSATGAEQTVSIDYLASYYRLLLEKAFNKPWFRGGFVWVVDKFNTKAVFDDGKPVSPAIKEFYSQNIEPATTGNSPLKAMTYNGGTDVGYAPLTRIKMPNRAYQSANMHFWVEGTVANSSNVPRTEILLHVGTGDTGVVQFVELRRLRGQIPYANLGYTQNGNEVTIWIRLSNGFAYRSGIISNNSQWGELIHLGDVATSEPTGLIKANTPAVVGVAPDQTFMSGAQTFTWNELQAYRKYKLNGSMSINLTNGVAGISMSTIVAFQQDTTGYRTLSLNSAISQPGLPVKLNPLPNSVTLVKFLWDGEKWNAWIYGSTEFTPIKYSISPSIGASSNSIIDFFISGKVINVNFEIEITATFTAGAETPLFYIADFPHPTKSYGTFFADAITNDVAGRITVEGAVVKGKAFTTIAPGWIRGSIAYIMS